MKSEPSTLEKIKEYLIPYYSCEYISKLSKEEILSKLSHRTEPEKFFRRRGLLASSKETKTFEGVVGIDDFKISKLSKQKKNYAPVISGRISSSNQYTKVTISMRLSYYVLIFIPIWLFVIGNFFLNDYDSFNDFTNSFQGTWIPVGFIVLTYIILTGSFHYHVANVKKTLEQIIEPTDDVDSGSSGASWIIRN